MEDMILFMDCGIHIFIYCINPGIGCFFKSEKWDKILRCGLYCGTIILTPRVNLLVIHHLWGRMFTVKFEVCKQRVLCQRYELKTFITQNKWRMGLTSAFAWISNFVNCVFFLLKGKKRNFFKDLKVLDFLLRLWFALPWKLRVLKHLLTLSSREGRDPGHLWGIRSPLPYPPSKFELESGYQDRDIWFLHGQFYILSNLFVLWTGKVISCIKHIKIFLNWQQKW